MIDEGINFEVMFEASEIEVRGAYASEFIVEK
jgi:hypothetical protein